MKSSKSRRPVYQLSSIFAFSLCNQSEKFKTSHQELVLVFMSERKKKLPSLCRNLLFTVLVENYEFSPTSLVPKRPSQLTEILHDLIFHILIIKSLIIKDELLSYLI